MLWRAAKEFCLQGLPSHHAMAKFENNKWLRLRVEASNELLQRQLMAGYFESWYMY